MKTNLAKIVALLIFANALICMQTGCGSIAPGHDEILVRAEQATQSALDCFDEFLKWEYENREALAGIPEIKHLADKIRVGGISWLKSARAATEAYRLNRTPENKANLDTAIAVLNTVLSEARGYLLAKNKKAEIRLGPIPCFS